MIVQLPDAPEPDPIEPEPDIDRTEYVVSWDQLSTRLHVLAGHLRGLHGLRGDVVGLHPLRGAEVPAVALSAATGAPVVDYVGSGVVLVGLVARRCAEAQQWVDQVGEGLLGVLWCFRAPIAPAQLITAPLNEAEPDGLGARPQFPVDGIEVPADWLVMPWESRRQLAVIAP